MNTANFFTHTRSTFWGGPWYPYWTLIAVTVLGGFFGLDHFYLRSPTSGLLKLLFNVFSLGLWYIYDILQILGEKDQVMKHGLSIPVVGPAGIGAGMFVDNQPGKPKSKSPWRFLLYLMAVCLPFGFDFFIAGDSSGGMARFVSTIMFPIGFIWGLVSMFQVFLTPQTVLEKGPYRMFPFSWFMNHYGPSKLGPVDTTGGPCQQDAGILGFLPPIVQTFLTIAFPGLFPALEGVALATRAGAGAVKAAANTATAVIEAAKEPTVAAVETASSIASTVPSALSAIPSITGQVTGDLQKMTTPEGLKALANKQVGGGSSSGAVDLETIGLLGTLAGVLGLGIYAGAKRLRAGQPILPAKKNGQTRNDTPPEPRGV